MPHDNPGKYNDACTVARMLAQAKGVLLIVIEGDHGSGFSVQVPPEIIPIIPGVLRSVAASIEHDPDQVTHVIDVLKDPLSQPP